MFVRHPPLSRLLCHIVGALITVVLVTTMLVPHMASASVTDMAMQHTTDMTSHGGPGQSHQHDRTPECVTACVGATLADLTLDVESADAFGAAFIGMSVIPNQPGRHIGPAERPPKFV